MLYLESLVSDWALHRASSAGRRADRVSHAIVRYRAVLQYSATHACPRPVKACLTLGRASLALLAVVDV